MDAEKWGNAYTPVIMQVGKNRTGDIIHKKKNSVYMIVFNRPYSKQLTVKVPKETQIINAVLLNGEKMKVTETARNEYNVGVPKQDFQEPFVIKLEIKSSKNIY